MFVVLCVRRLLQQVRDSRRQIRQELKEREEVERELSQVKFWIQDTLDLLLSSSRDMDTLLPQLEVLRLWGTALSVQWLKATIVFLVLYLHSC